MADTTFVNRVTPITAEWLNDINDAVYGSPVPGSWINTAYGRTALEITNSVVPSNYAYFPGDIRRYGAIINGVTNDTTAWASALASGHPVWHPGGISVASVSIRKDNAAFYGPGENIAIIKAPSGALSVGGVVEVGDTTSGNSATAYDKFTWKGIGVDGNKASTTAPTDDLKGHGITLTKITNWFIQTRVVNCYNAGVGIFINSNYGSINAQIENCGNVTYTQPGFDINSSKYITGTVRTKDCYVGSRLLDNCWGNILDISIYNSTSDGFIYQNQAVNESHTNELTVTVYTAGGKGVLIQENVRNSNLNLSVYNSTGIGCYIVDGSVAANTPSNLNIRLNTKSSGGQGLLCYGNDCNIQHNSYLDGRTGAQGTSFACDVYGDRNAIDFKMQDSSTWQVRGLAIRAAADSNVIKNLSYTNTADPYSDSGTNTQAIFRMGKGVDIASGASIILPVLGSVFVLTGTTAVTSIAATSNTNRTITLITSSTASLTDGSNLKLAGNFSGTADDAITLFCDGTNWYELSRSVN